MVVKALLDDLTDCIAGPDHSQKEQQLVVSLDSELLKLPRVHIDVSCRKKHDQCQAHGAKNLVDTHGYVPVVRYVLKSKQDA